MRAINLSTSFLSFEIVDPLLYLVSYLLVLLSLDTSGCPHRTGESAQERDIGDPEPPGQKDRRQGSHHDAEHSHNPDPEQDPE